jgi:two-component system, chemotaxis family, CheB/CheR fusion protein
LTLDIGFPVEQFIELVRASLRPGSEGHKITVEAVNRRGWTIQCHVTTSPFVTPSGGNRGVILLMEEQHEIQSDG